MYVRTSSLGLETPMNVYTPLLCNDTRIEYDTAGAA